MKDQKTSYGAEDKYSSAELGATSYFVTKLHNIQDISKNFEFEKGSRDCHKK